MKQRLPEAFSQARQAIKKFPDVGYFHYVLSLTADHEEGLRAAKVCRSSLLST